MSFMDILSLLWSILWLLISIAFMWGVGLAGSFFIFTPVKLAIASSVSSRRRCPELLFTILLAGIMAGLAILLCHLKGISPGSVLGLLLPLEDIQSVMGLPDGGTLVSGMRESPTSFLTDVFSTPEVYCTIFGSAILTALISLVRNMFSRKVRYQSLLGRILHGLADMVLTFAIMTIAYAFAQPVRDILTWIITWGTGNFYFNTDGPLLLKILYCPFIIILGAIMIGIFMTELTSNTFFAVIFGSIFSQMLHQPTFSDASKTGYIILSLTIVFLLKILSPTFHKIINRYIDTESETEEISISYLDYVFNGISFLAGALITIVLSLLYFIFLA